MIFDAQGWLTNSPDDGTAITRVPIGMGAFFEEPPTLIVIHYGVTDSLDALVAAQQHQNYGAHFSIDGFREGERSIAKVVQHRSILRRAGHAGASSWRGRSACNDFSIGIEISNPGPIVNGRTVYGKPWPLSETVSKPVPQGFPRTWTAWAEYTDEELDLVARLCATIKLACPSIRDVAGHSEVSPGRKFDPGPAFPLAWLRTVLGLELAI